MIGGQLIMNVERVCKAEATRAGFEQRWTTATAFKSFCTRSAFTGGVGEAVARSLNHSVEDNFQKIELRDTLICRMDSGGMCSIYSSQLVSAIILTM